MLELLTSEQKIKMYLDYANNFLTVKKFAKHYGIEKTLATDIIFQGREENYNLNYWENQKKTKK